MRFGAAISDATSQGSAWNAAAQVEGTRAGIHWFGLTVASFEHGDIRQSPNGVYVYSDNGRREVRVEGGRGTGTVEMADMYAAVTEDKPIVHDGRWGMATLEVGQAMVQSARERREILLTKQCSAPE